MGIGAPTSVLGFTHLTKGLHDSQRTRRLEALLSCYPSNTPLDHETLQQIQEKFHPESQPGADTSPDLISCSDTELCVTRVFFHCLNEKTETPESVLLKCAATFERDPKILREAVTRSLKAISHSDSVSAEVALRFRKDLVQFVLHDLSAVIIDWVSHSKPVSLDNVKLINLIVKIHRLYQRIEGVALDKVCALSFPGFPSGKAELKLDSIPLLPVPAAYRVFAVAGELLRLEQRYHDPVHALLPSHVYAQHAVLVRLPFWFQDCAAVYGYLKPYMTKKDKGVDKSVQENIVQTLFLEVTELGRICRLKFVHELCESEFDVRKLALCCMSCCIDPRETLADCLWDLSGGNMDEVRAAMRTMLGFALGALGRITLSEVKDPIYIGRIESLMKLDRVEDLDGILRVSFPTIMATSATFTKADLQLALVGDDCLATRLIDAAASYGGLRGKIVDVPQSIVPSSLLVCSTLLKELRFNLEDAASIHAKFKSLAGVSSEVLAKSLAEEIGCATFIQHFYLSETDRFDLDRMGLAAVSLCLDQGCTMGDTLCLILGGAPISGKEAHTLVKQMCEFVIKDVARMMLPKLEKEEDFASLCALQRRYTNITEIQLKTVVIKVAPFTQLLQVRKEDIKFCCGDDRFAYAVLALAAEELVGVSD